MQDGGDTTAACWINDGVNVVAHGDASTSSPTSIPHGAAFTSGDTHVLTADFNGTARADVYEILFVPDGTFYALGASAPNVLAPAASNLQLASTLDAPLLTHTFGGAEAAE